VYARWARLYVLASAALLALAFSEVTAAAAPAAWTGLPQAWLGWMLLCLALTIALSEAHQWRTVYRLRALQQVAIRLSRPQHLHSALDEALQQSLKVARASGGVVLVRHPEGEVQTVVSRGLVRDWPGDPARVLRIVEEQRELGSLILLGAAPRPLPRALKRMLPSVRTRAALLQPLEVDGQLIALMVLAFRRCPSLDAEERATLRALGSCMAAACNSATLFSHALREAMTDPLTGVATRRWFNRSIDKECARALRHGRPLSLLILDVNNFKEINDRWGHQEGDQVLREIGRILRQVRVSDVAARLGGDEFCLLLSETDIRGAREVADRVVDDVTKLHTQGRLRFPVSVSVGVAQMGATGASGLMRAADEAMYEKKRGAGKPAARGSRAA